MHMCKSKATAALGLVVVACADPNPSTLNQKCFYDEDCDDGQHCELIPERNDGLCRLGEGENEASSSGDSGVAESTTGGSTGGPTSMSGDATSTDDGTTSGSDSGDADTSSDETGEPGECPVQPPADEVSYALPTHLSIDPNPQGVALGDLDADGDLDLAVTSRDDGTITVFFNDGAGTMSPGPVTGLGPQFPTSIALGAIADGTVDAVVVVGSQAEKQILRARGNGDGSFSGNTSFGATTGSLALADVNDNGILDLLGGTNDGLTVALGSAANETFGVVQTFFLQGSPIAIATGDLDGDGDLDVVGVHYTGQAVMPMLGAGNGTFQAQPTLTAGGLARDVKLADFDGDGNVDVVYVTAGQDSDAARVRWGNGDGTLSATMEVLSVGLGPSSVATGDIDRDGDDDIVVASQSGSISVILSKGDRTFEPATTISCNGSLRAVDIGDLDDDCVLDVVAVAGTDEVCILLSN
jgi:hypothetical protein